LTRFGPFTPPRANASRLGSGATPEELAKILTVKTASAGEVPASKRKVLTHALIHGIRHWAQIAMALRQGCFVSGWSHDMMFSPALR
jgi:uncharacterized damage-inducible protein DinB